MIQTSGREYTFEPVMKMILFSLYLEHKATVPIYGEKMYSW
jgi:hypothetical protein